MISTAIDATRWVPSAMTIFLAMWLRMGGWDSGLAARRPAWERSCFAAPGAVARAGSVAVFGGSLLLCAGIAVMSLIWLFVAIRKAPLHA